MSDLNLTSTNEPNYNADLGSELDSEQNRTVVLDGSRNEDLEEANEAEHGMDLDIEPSTNLNEPISSSLVVLEGLEDNEPEEDKPEEPKDLENQSDMDDIEVSLVKWHSDPRNLGSQSEDFNNRRFKLNNPSRKLEASSSEDEFDDIESDSPNLRKRSCVIWKSNLNWELEASSSEDEFDDNTNDNQELNHHNRVVMKAYPRHSGDHENSLISRNNDCMRRRMHSNWSAAESSSEEESDSTVNDESLKIYNNRIARGRNRLHQLRQDFRYLREEGNLAYRGRKVLCEEANNIPGAVNREEETFNFTYSGRDGETMWTRSTASTSEDETFSFGASTMNRTDDSHNRYNFNRSRATNNSRHINRSCHVNNLQNRNRSHHVINNDPRPAHNGMQINCCVCKCHCGIM